MAAFYSLLCKAIKKQPAGRSGRLFWRSGRDSNPRAIARKLISSQCRYQREVYMSCMKDGMTCKEFAASHGNTPQGVHQTITLIRVRAKEFFKNI